MKNFLNFFKRKGWMYLFPLVVFLLVAVTYKVSDSIPVNVVLGGFAAIVWVWTIAVNEMTK